MDACYDQITYYLYDCPCDQIQGKITKKRRKEDMGWLLFDATHIPNIQDKIERMCLG